MGRGTCRDCGSDVRYFAGKGTSIKNVRCSKCGGEVVGKTVGKTGANKGKKAERCVLCGRRIFKAEHPPHPFRGRWISDENTVHPAGSAVCCFHDIVDVSMEVQ
ncbi:MAG: hypothetical protein WC683_04855 [bacterium]|jgi:DNA-directed RNA polymerase subunit RPC12/RpoP